MNNFVKAIVISTAALSTQVMADVDTQAAFSNLEPTAVSQEAILTQGTQAQPVVHSTAFEGLEPSVNTQERQLTDYKASFEGDVLLASILEPAGASKEALL